MAIVLDGHLCIWSWPVTMHDDQGPGRRERGRDGGSLKLLTYLTVWTVDDRFFAFLVYCMLPRPFSDYWRKETEKWIVFCGVVGLDGRCSAQAEQRKEPVAVGPLPGAYLSTETNLVRFVAWWKRSLIPDTFTHTHTHTHTHTTCTQLKRRGPHHQVPGASAHVTPSKNKYVWVWVWVWVWIKSPGKN